MATISGGGPRIRGRGAVLAEVTAAAAGSLVLAAGMTWPVLPRAGSAIPGTGVDPFIEVWSLAWSGHALNPFSGFSGPVFSGNAFYPARDSLAFTDSLLGLGPLAWPFGEQRVAAAFSIVFVLMAALSVFGAYLLARQLGAHWIGAAVAGAAFAFPVWRLGQLGHLHVLVTGPMVLALALLARGHGLRWVPPPSGQARPRSRPLWIVAGWLMASWQLTIGFAGGLPFAYGMAGIGLIVLFVPVRARLTGRPVPITWPVAAADTAGAVIFLVAGLVMATPYLRVQTVDPDAVLTARGPGPVREFSPPWSGLVTPPSASGTWSWLTDGGTLASRTNEARVLPGVVLLVLAVLGLLISRWTVRWRVVLALALAGSVLLALGSSLSIAGQSPFLILYDHAPGWASDRTSGRLIVFTTLALALLAAGAVTGMLRAAQRWRPASRIVSRAGLGAALLLPVLVLAEGWGPVPTTPLPLMPRAVRAAPGPTVVLPSVWTKDSQVMYWTALRGFPPLANGSSGITPSSLKVVRAQLLHFPDARSVAYLRASGFASVVVLKQNLRTRLWRDAGQVPAPELRLTRTDLGDSILFTLGPRAES